MAQVLAFLMSHSDEYLICCLTHSDFLRFQLSGINETLSNSLISKPTECEQKPALPASVPKHSVNIGKTSNRPIITYAPSHLSRERVYEPSLLHDLSQLRFACRLLTLLKSQNFEIKIKPHPGCKTNIYEKVATFFDVESNTKTLNCYRKNLMS